MIKTQFWVGILSLVLSVITLGTVVTNWEFTRQSYKISKIPFLTITNLTLQEVSSTAIQLQYEVVNPTDSPAIITSYEVDLEPPIPSNEFRPIVESNKVDWIAAKQTRKRIETYYCASEAALATFHQKVADGEITFVITVKLSDIFDDNLVLKCKLAHKPTEKQFLMTDLHYEGIPSLGW